MHALGPCGSLQQTLLCGWQFLLWLPQPPWVFSHRGLKLYFPTLEPWVTQSASLPAVYPCLSMRECGARGCYPRSACPVLCHSESGPPGLSVCKCRAAGSASGQTACPVHPTLHQSRSRHSNAILSTPPTGRDECLFFISLVSDFLAIRFSVSSSCVRRRSVSTYAAILVPPRDQNYTPTKQGTLTATTRSKKEERKDFS